MQINYGYDSALIERRGVHDKIMVEKVRDGSRMKAARIVVQPDRRVVELLEELGLWGAYEAIARAVSIRTAGLGAQSMDLSRVRGAGNSGVEAGAELLMAYDKWASECRRKYLSPIMVFDYLIDGLSFRDIDRKRKFMNGTAKNNLLSCLRLWATVK